MALTVYQYPKCSTCRKALKWLDAHGVAYEAIDIVATPPGKALLTRSIANSAQPLRAFFNTSGESYRNGGYKDKLKDMSQSEAVAALHADGKLIKRPFAVRDGAVLLGFDEEAWAEALL